MPPLRVCMRKNLQQAAMLLLCDKPIRHVSTWNFALGAAVKTTVFPYSTSPPVKGFPSMLALRLPFPPFALKTILYVFVVQFAVYAVFIRLNFEFFPNSKLSLIN